MSPTTNDTTTSSTDDATTGTTPAPEAIHAVLFDLDGTLAEYRRSSQAVLEIAFDRAGVEPFFATDDWRALIADRGNGVGFGEPQDTEFVDACFAELAMRRGRDPDPARAVARHYREARDHRNVRFRPGAEAALERATARYPVGLVTNGGYETQRTKLEALGLTDTFDAFVYACEAVPPKPDPTPFETALDELGVAADRTVHVGDDYAADIEGAAALGIAPVWLYGDRTEDPDPGLEDLHLLPAMTEFDRLPWF